MNYSGAGLVCSGISCRKPDQKIQHSINQTALVAQKYINKCKNTEFIHWNTFFISLFIHFLSFILGRSTREHLWGRILFSHSSSRGGSLTSLWLKDVLLRETSCQPRVQTDGSTRYRSSVSHRSIKEETVSRLNCGVASILTRSHRLNEDTWTTNTRARSSLKQVSLAGCHVKS